MAENINLREQEYNTVLSDLEQFHTTQLEAITDILEKLRSLATSQHGLYAEKTSEKISDVVDCITEDVMGLLEQAFGDSESGICDMITTTMAVDTACN